MSGRGHLRNLRARAAGRARRGLHAGLGGTRRALDVTAGAALGTHVSGAPRRATAPADAHHALHGRPRQMGGAAVMVDTLAARRAMLIGNPEVTEQEAKGHTPRGACQPVVAEGVRLEKLSTEVEALAYRHVTRMAVPGQRTGRVNRTQDAIGVRS